MKESTPFMNIADASRATGLSQNYIRNGIRSGEIPHLRAGRKIYVNVSALLRKLGVEAEKESA